MEPLEDRWHPNGPRLFFLPACLLATALLFSSSGPGRAVASTRPKAATKPKTTAPATATIRPTAKATAATKPGKADGLAEVSIEKVIKDSAGGSFTPASIVTIGGRKVFLKSNAGNVTRGTRYSNFESDILGGKIFKLLGMRAPQATMVRLHGRGKLASRLGSPALAMEFVDSRWAAGRVFEGFWPGLEQADSDAFLRMLLVDIVMGNGDRRDANFFVTCSFSEPGGKEGPGSFRPIPIDNNCGLGTMVFFTHVTSQCNFLPTYDGLGDGQILRDLGTIRNLVDGCPEMWALLGERTLRPRLLTLARDLQKRLDDKTLNRLVNALPDEIIPSGVTVPARPASLENIPAAVAKVLIPFDHDLKGAELLAWRRHEICTTLAWRRDHLIEALKKYFTWRDRDPEEKERALDMAAWQKAMADARARKRAQTATDSSNDGAAH